MADVAQLLSQIMSSEDGRKQVGQVLSMLGQNGQNGQGNQNSQPAQNVQSNQNDGGQGGGFDLSALSSLLGGQNNSAPSTANSGGGFDLSGLMSMLGGQGGQSGPNNSDSSGGGQAAQGGGFDLSSLLSGLGGGGGGGGEGLPKLDFGKLMKVQQILSQSRNDPSANLLRALKPHLTTTSTKKVDEAIHILELLNLLPLLKESGLFGALLGGDSE